MNLNDFGTTPLNDGVDVDHLPEQMGGFTPPPQPGTYRFELPALTPEAFAEVTSEQYGKRVQVKFNDEAPLKIVQTPPAMKDEYLGAPFTTQLSNVPRKRGRGDNAPIASDWDYLNRALGEPKRPATNADYCKALIAQSQKAPKPTFQADIEWSYSCNPRRDARFATEEGSTTVVQATDEAGVPQVDPNTQAPVNIKGCGARIYMKDVTKVDGKYPLTVECSCHATVRGFPNLVRFEK